MFMLVSFLYIFVICCTFELLRTKFIRYDLRYQQTSPIKEKKTISVDTEKALQPEMYSLLIIPKDEMQQDQSVHLQYEQTNKDQTVCTWNVCVCVYLRQCVCPTSLFLDPADLESSLYMAKDLSWFTKSLSDLQHTTQKIYFYTKQMLWK